LTFEGLSPSLLSVKGAELIRKLQRLGKQRGVPVRFVAERGKGSHGTLYYADRFTVVKDRKKEISPGLLSAMLAQLGLSRDDLA
jgi:mRNA interferase HicA